MFFAGETVDLADDSTVARLSNRQRPVIRLILLATALTCCALLAVSLWFISALRTMQIEQARVATTNVARMIGAQVEATMKTANVLLIDVTDRVEHRAASDLSNATLARYLASVAEATHELHGLFVYGKDGAWLAASMAGNPQGNNADRGYFQYHRRETAQGMYIWPPVRSKATRDWIIPVSMRIDDAQGQFNGVALATFKVNFFEKIYDDLSIGSTGTVLLALRNGTIVYRRPFHEATIGSNISNGAILGELARQATGTAMSKATAACKR